jgi:alkanesulfonate monooxygenase SsuD/methylene tetrahydromethanopterin reductase-like flavin-dependent oxidoreductase (luciferase family)
MPERESSSLPALKLGMFVPEELPSPEAIELAVSLEPAGFTNAWMTEISREPFVRAATVLDRTSTLRVGTAIAVWSRSPVTAAMTAGELHEISSGRFDFGVGVGTEYISEHFHNIPWDKPASRMAEYLRIIRGAWGAGAGRTFTFQGAYHGVRDYSQPYFREHPPLFLAAVQKGMLRLAARQADGVIFNPGSTTRYCEQYALPTLESAARDVGRELKDLERIVALRCAVADDRERARHWARLGISEYGRYPVHRRVYEMNGFDAEAAAIAAAMSDGDLDRAAAAVSDAMVEQFSLAGTPDDVRAQLRRWEGLVDAVALSSPTTGLTPEELRENCAAMRGAFATVRR